MFRKLLGYLPWNKWCGCSLEFEDEVRYQFRVKARMEDTQDNLFQIREKRVCEHCNSEDIGVKVEAECTYDPIDNIHERKVGVDENDMVNYGFMPEPEMVRMLIEMRLSDSLKDLETAE